MHMLKLAVIVFPLLLAACGGNKTPESRIRELVRDMAAAAEDESMRPLAAAISDRYYDLRGNDRQAVINIMRAFMLRTDKVLIFADTDAVTMLTPTLAEARVRVRFAGANIERFGLRTSVYNFVLELQQVGDDWQIVSARWAEGDGEPR